MSKKLSGKYYQRNKKLLQKEARERYQNLPNEKKKKRDNLFVNVTKISQKMKKKKKTG